MKAVVIGAGRVGCGFVGQVLAEAGHQVIVTARDAAVAARINRHRGYQVRLVRAGQRPTVIRVDGVRAVPAADRDQVAEEIADSRLVGTAVGARRLAEVAPAIAAGLRRAGTGVNVVAFENAADPGRLLHREVTGISDTAHRHGFASGLVFRIVAGRQLPADPAAPVMFTADTERQVVVDGTGLVAPLPAIQGMTTTASYPAWVRRKLFTFNAAHAAAAYLGRLKGYTYIHAAVRDPQIRALVRQVADLGQAGLRARYGTELATGCGAAAVLPRLDNAALDDTVDRVAADPLRKLAAHERLAGAAVCAQEAGRHPQALAVVIAAALRAAQDDGLTELAADQVLCTVCGLDPSGETGRAVLDQLAAWHPVPADGVLVDLDRGSWAWRRQTPIRSAA